MTSRDLINRIKKIFGILWSTLKIILWSLLVIISIFLFLPQSEEELKDAARFEFELIAFKDNIDSDLFESEPAIKYKNGKKWYEWVYRSDSDSLAIGVTVSKYRILNFFSAEYYFSGNLDLREKLEYTDSIYSKNNPINSKKRPL